MPPRKSAKGKDTSRPEKERLVSHIQPEFASKAEATEFAESIPVDYLECRVGLRHRWERLTARFKGGVVEQTIFCERCGTERVIKMTKRGKRKGGRYKHPDDYVNTGGGRFNAAGMEAMRAVLNDKIID